MDGFHLAQAELVRLGQPRPHGRAATRSTPPATRRCCGGCAPRDETVYAPAFRREIEEPIAGAIAVPPEVPLVVTEGNYLLLDEGDWARSAPLLDEAWYVEMDEATRLEWLIARHVEFGKTPEAAARVGACAPTSATPRSWRRRAPAPTSWSASADAQLRRMAPRSGAPATMPAPTVSFVPSSIRMNAPVTRLAA